jgi:hypothetical protein
MTVLYEKSVGGGPGRAGIGPEPAPSGYEIGVQENGIISVRFPCTLIGPVSVKMDPDVARKFLATLTRVIGDAT